MSLYKSPVTTLLEVIGKNNGDIVLNPADFDFVGVKPNDTGKNPTHNTHVFVQSNNNVAAYQGSVEVFYNRLKLEDLGKMVQLSLKGDQIGTSHDIVPLLNSRFGTVFETTDFELVNAVDEGGYKSIQLTARSSSLGWTGTTRVTVAQGDVPLADHLKVTTLNGLDYPTPYATLPFAQMYSYWRDFSAHTPFLKTVKTNDPVPAQMATVLTDVTGDLWVATGSSQYSLGGSKIIWAGLTKDNGLFNVSYTYGIQIRLDHDDSTGITGDLVIHFNDPVDPALV